MSGFEGKLATLREQFVRNAFGRLKTLDVSIGRLSEDGADSLMLDRAMRVFHFFGGVGTTYGFPEVTRAGRSGEKICDQVMAAERIITDEEIAALQRELGSIRLAIEGDRVTQPPAQRILLLDEDPEETSFIRMILETVGYDVRVCEDEKYLDADLRAFTPHLLLATERAVLTAGMAFITAPEHAGRAALVISDAVNDAAVPEAPPGPKLRRPLTPALLISSVADCLQNCRNTP
jgi:hypothetical protein